MSIIINVLLNCHFWPIPFALIIIFTKKEKLKKIFYFLFLTTYLIPYSPLSKYLYHNLTINFKKTNSLERLQYGVVLLGGTIEKNKNANTFIYRPDLSRILEGLRLYKLNLIKKIYLAGGDPQGKKVNVLTEAKSAKVFLKQLGVPENDILIENKSINTFQNAKNLQSKISPNEKFYLITNDYHLKRSSMTFNYFNYKYIPHPVEYLSRQPPSLLGWSLANKQLLNKVLHENIGIFWYNFRYFR